MLIQSAYNKQRAKQDHKLWVKQQEEEQRAMEEQSKRHREERERRQEMLRKKPELQLQMILNGRRYECFSDWWESEMP
jgi:hypothetical protein